MSSLLVAVTPPPIVGNSSLIVASHVSVVQSPVEVGVVVKAGAEAYQHLRSQILAGEHPPGTWLREEELAASLGLSRTPVREALRRLHSEGLVDLFPGRGAQVPPWSDSDLDELFQLRALLEGYAARRAAETRMPIDDLSGLCAAMEQQFLHLDDSGYNEITQLNLQFHSAVHLGSGNPWLPRLLSSVIQVPLVRHTFHHYTSNELSRSFAQHRELIEAVALGDGAWAESVMSTHVLAARASLRNAARNVHASSASDDQ